MSSGIIMRHRAAGEISAPTLIVVGRAEFICPPSQAKIMRESIPKTRSWSSSSRAATSRTWRKRKPSSMRSVGGSGVPNEESIHLSAWKVNSANFALTEFSEVRS
jgi:pimeloyl-ACP methyl ester carboxylesterase